MAIHNAHGRLHIPKQFQSIPSTLIELSHAYAWSKPSWVMSDFVGPARGPGALGWCLDPHLDLFNREPSWWKCSNLRCSTIEQISWTFCTTKQRSHSCSGRPSNTGKVKCLLFMVWVNHYRSACCWGLPFGSPSWWVTYRHCNEWGFSVCACNVP